MISTEPHGPFFIPFKFAFATAFALAIPVILYQLWAFIAPGLYQNEKKIVLPLVVSSTLLFYFGVMFAYYVVFPIIFKFFIGMAPGWFAGVGEIPTAEDIAANLGKINSDEGYIIPDSIAAEMQTLMAAFKGE